MKIKINKKVEVIETVMVNRVPCLSLESLAECSIFSDINEALGVAMKVIGGNIEEFKFVRYDSTCTKVESYAFPRVEACLVAQAIEFGLGYHLHEAWSEAEKEMKDKYKEWFGLK